MTDSKDQEPDQQDDELRVVDDTEGVVRLDAAEIKPLEKRGKVAVQPLASALAGEDSGGNSDQKDQEGREKETRILEEPGENDDDTVVPMGWFYLLGVGLVAVMVWMGVQIFLGEEDEAGFVTPSGEEKESPVLSELESRREAEAHFRAMEELLTNFLAADTIEERLKYVRHPDRIKPLMEDFYQKNELRSYEFETVRSYQSVSLSLRSFIALDVMTAGKSSVPILVEDGEEGMQVDWESFVCYNPMTPEEMIEERPTEPVTLRVYATVDNFFAYDFSEESEWICFRLEFRRSDGFLYGYVKRGTIVEQKFRDVFGKQEFQLRKPLILKVSFPEGGKGKKSVLIEDLKSGLWAFAKNPEAEPEK